MGCRAGLCQPRDPNITSCEIPADAMGCSTSKEEDSAKVAPSAVLQDHS